MIFFCLDAEQAKYLGATLGHVDENIRLVGLQVGGEARLRTGWSKLVLFPSLGNFGNRLS